MNKVKLISSLLFLCGLAILSGFSLSGDQPGMMTYPREELRFEVGPFKIVGDLHIPDPGKRQPAIIIVHGDGPAGRSFSREPNPVMRTFLDIGFACLIYDKPGYGESTGEFTRGNLFDERASILLAAVKALMNHPAVNPARIGFWGASQAGYVMPKAVNRTADVAFMIAVSCPGTDSVEQSAYLVEKQILCEGYGVEASKRAGRFYRQRARAQTYQEYLEAAEYLSRDPVVSAMKWGGVRSETDFTPPPPSHQMFFNPVTLLEKIQCPVLAIFGENDTQIDPRQGVEAYQSALDKAGNPFFRIALLPGANHGILLSETGCMKDWGQNRGYAPGYLELMREWLASLLERWKSVR